MDKRMYLKINLFLILIIPITSQLSTTYLNLGSIIYIPYILIIITSLFYKKNNLKNTKNYNLVSIILTVITLSFIISPIVSFNIFKYDPIKNIMYIMLFLIFILTIFIVSINFINNYNDFLKFSLIGNSIILIYNLIFNIKELNYINFQTILTENRGDRASFGFVHPNIAAMFIIIEMILIYLFFIKEKKKCFIPYINISILCIFLIATGSRTANIVVVIFSIFSIYNKLIKRLNVYIRLIMFLIMISIALILLTYKFDLNSILQNSSGRDIAFSINIVSIKTYGNILTGISPQSIENLSKYIFLDYADNWYLVQLIQFGFIGLIIFFISIIFMIYIFIKNNNKVCLNLLICLLIYSFAERVLFVPGVLLSFIIWCIFLINLCKKNYI